MEIESYADFSLVKKRYRELALLYHPDKNPKNKHAEEYFKILTQGYNLLSDALQKANYDEALRNYYAFKSKQGASENRNEQVREKLRKHAENKRLQFIENYVQAENVFPHRYRFLLALLLYLSGLLMCYNNWFLNFLNFNIFYIVIGSFLFGLGTYLMAENIYQRRSFKKAMLIEDYINNTGPAKIFAVLFFITPVLFLTTMQITKKVHLTYFYEITVVKKIEIYGDVVSYNYTVNDIEISRRTDASPGVFYNRLSRLRVKFSKINPNISELVVLDDD